MSLRSSSSAFTEEDTIEDQLAAAKINDASLRSELLRFIGYFLASCDHTPLWGFLGDCTTHAVPWYFEGHASRMFKLGRRA